MVITNMAESDGVVESIGEGRGVAAVDWRAAVEKLALKAARPLEPQARRLALGTVQDLIGFCALWQLEGGMAGLERLGMGLGRRSIGRSSCSVSRLVRTRICSTSLGWRPIPRRTWRSMACRMVSSGRRCRV